jgi:hypothetical protein
MISRSVLLRMRSFSYKNFSENQKISFHVQFIIFLILQFVRKCAKFCRAGQDTNDNIALAHCVLDTHKHSQYAIVIAFAQ